MASKHADEGGEEKKGGETSEGKHGKTWEKIRHRFPLHESRALSSIMQDIVETAAAIEEARERVEKGHLYREWLKEAQKKIVVDGNMLEACVGMNDIITDTQVRGGWTTLIQFVTKEVERTENRHIELLNLVTLAQGIYHKTKAYISNNEMCAPCVWTHRAHRALGRVI